MFKQLKIYYFFVSLPFVLLLTGSTVFFDAIQSTITRNPHPQINYTIFVIILGGGVIVLHNSRRLMREAMAITEFSEAIHGKIDQISLQQMANSYSCDIACLLQMISTSGDRTISHQEQAALEHELANVNSRLNRRNALPQYLTGLLVGMGLLGTFIGLLATLSDISALITSFADLDMSTADPIVVFRNMIDKMRAPMQSMAIAFSASMFGLLGSIILGLMMVGIRRLQGDIYSLLSSETARHIELALSYETASFRSGVEYTGDVSDLAKVLIQMEERFAESTRLQQRTLTAVIDDFQNQRGDMLKTMIDQTDASNGFKSELKELGSRLGNIFGSMEKNNSTMSSQLSDLTIQLAAEAKETHKLLGSQVDEQKRLSTMVDNYNIEERMTESARAQQRILNSVIEDFQNQRADMQRTISEQTEASNNFRTELQQVGKQLGSIFASMERGNSEISAQLSDLTVRMSADAKQSHMLQTGSTNTFKNEIQTLANKLSADMERDSETLSSLIQELMTKITSEAAGSNSVLTGATGELRSELKQLAEQLSSMTAGIESGNGDICANISGLLTKLGAESQESQTRLDRVNDTLTGQLSQLGGQLTTIGNSIEQGDDKVASLISELSSDMSTGIDGSQERINQQLDRVGTVLKGELTSIGGRIGDMTSGIEKGNRDICSAIAENSASAPEKDDEQVEL